MAISAKNKRYVMSVQQQWNDWLKAGDDKLWNDIYKYLVPRFHSYLIKTIHDSEKRWDIINATLIKIVEKKHLYNPEFKFTTWAYAILNNERLLTWKKHGRHNTSYDELIENKWIYEPTDTTEYDTTVEPLYMRTVEILRDLEEPYGELLRLRELENYSYEELQQHFGWKMNTIKTRIRRGREIVRDRVNKDAFLNSLEIIYNHPHLDDY